MAEQELQIRMLEEKLNLVVNVLAETLPPETYREFKKHFDTLDSVRS